MDADTILMILEKLVGEIEPYGDSAIDNIRMGNLNCMVEIVDQLLYQLYRVTKYKERNEWSMSAMGKIAYDALDRWLSEFGEIISTDDDEPEYERSYTNYSDEFEDNSNTADDESENYE